MDLTPAELTLLGLLVEKPRHGYELEEVIAARGMRDWTEIGFSSIYYLLTKLRDRGLIAETGEPARGKARKVFAPTPNGFATCAAAAEEAVATLRPVFPPVLVGLANQPVIPPARLRAALDQRAAALTDKIAEIRTAADQQEVPPFVHAIFDYSLGQLEAEQQWLTRYRGELVMAPYDVKRELKDLYAPKNREWRLIDVPAQQFVAVDGVGDPNTSPDYTRAVEALYSVAYTAKFASKRAGRDFVVGPLEGLWWSPDPAVFTTRAKGAWHWRMLISLPAWVTAEEIKDATDAALAKKKLPTISHVRHETLREGTCAQALHIGSYDDEGPLMARLHDEYLPAKRLVLAGLHHEIYLGDPRKTAPEKLKTVIRQPVTGGEPG